MSGKATLLVNPAARAGTAGTSAEAVAAELSSLGFDTELIRTTSARHATQTAADAAPDDLVLPLGGDGMISFVAQGCVSSGALLTPLPAGRGNDFIRALALPRDTLAVARGLASASERRIDVGRCTGRWVAPSAGRAEHAAPRARPLANPEAAIDAGRVFVGTATSGFDALTNEQANRLRRLRGPAVYTAAGVWTALRMRPARFTLRTSGPDGEREESFEGWNVSVGNSGRHGGGLTATPGADLADGLLDVVISRGRRFDQLASCALLERGGHQVRLPHVRAWRATKVELDATSADGGPLTMYADGEPVVQAPTTIDVVPGALRLYY